MENGFSLGSIGSSRDEDTVKIVTAQKEQNKTHHKKGEKKQQTNSFYVGDLRSNHDVVSDKFARAQKNAIKRLLDQFESDIKIDEGMEESTKHAEELGASVTDSVRQLKELDERREDLMKQYEIDSDSQEQKDLELMQKANAAQKDPLNKDLQLTEEEKKRLAELPPVTDYQEAMLLCDKEEEKLRDTIRDNRIDIKIENATVQATQKALLKVHPMVDAKKEADEIIENALKEQVSDLLQEGVDKIDSDIAESQKEMAEAQEKALEEKIQREKLKEEDAKKEEMEQELQGTILSTTMQAMSYEQQVSQNLQTNIKSLIQDQIVLDVDLKGLRVNKQV